MHVGVTTAELVEARADAEALMVSRARVRRKTATAVQDEGTGLRGATWQTVYDGIFKLGGPNSGSAQTTRTTPGGVEVHSAARTGHFPASTTDLLDGDLVDIYEGENAGIVVEILEADWKDLATARRVPVIAAERPPGWDEE